MTAYAWALLAWAQIFVPGAYEDGFNLANLPDRLPFLTLPASSKREDFVQFIEELAKQSESPEWLGLPETAETMLRTVKGRDTCLRIGKLQGDAGGGDDDSEEGGGGERARVAKQMVEFSEHILAQLPESLVRHHVSVAHFRVRLVFRIFDFP
jgi:hypothetical protein